MSKWNYDRHPILALKFEDALQELKALLAQRGSSYFQKMITEYFLNNNHRVHLEVRFVFSATLLLFRALCINIPRCLS